MIKADLHLHTYCSHGLNSPLEMHAAARKKGLALIGFSEHSPRPEGYNYSHEYREKLTRLFPQYISSVRALKRMPLTGPEVLLGLEMDWFSAEPDFVRAACSAYDYDYIIGSVHFLDHWGFDDSQDAWHNASREVCEARYEHYFRTWQQMLASGLFQIAAHPDLIKIFSVRRFHAWLEKPESRALVRSCLETLRDSGMALEISSAGLRKPCREIYPCAGIMEIAADLKLRITFASDAHCTDDVCADFDLLANYARSFGFGSQTVFAAGKILSLSF